MWNEDKEQARFDRARAAVRNFSFIAPRLTAYARSITEGKVRRVVAGESSMTDGETIYIRPPMMLAERVAHKYTMCDEFDGNNESLCPACARGDRLMESFTHEIGHILQGSFVSYSRSQVNDRLNHASTQYGSPVAQEMADSGVVEMKSTIEWAGKAKNKIIGTCVLFGEDMRCNRGMYELVPSFLRDRRIMHQRILDEGVELADGRTFQWIDADRDQQFLMAIYMNATDQMLDGRLDPEVVEASQTPVMRSHTAALANSWSSLETLFMIGDMILDARKLGFLLDDPNSDDEDDEQSDEQSDGEGNGGGEGGTGEQSDDDSDQSDGGGSGDTQGITDEQMLTAVLGHDHNATTAEAEDGTGDDLEAQSNASQDEADLTKVIGSARLLDRTPVNLDAPFEISPDMDVSRGPFTGGHYGTYTPAPMDFSESDVASAISRARIVFSNNRKAHVTRNQKAGKVSSKVLGRRAPIGDERLFARRVEPTKRSYHVVATGDISYSTVHDSVQGYKVLEHIKCALMALGTTMHRVGVDFSLYGHSTMGESAVFAQIKGPKQAWDDRTKDNLRNLSPCNSNVEGHTLQYMRKQVEATDATDKIILLFTDGVMPGINGEEEEYLITEELALCKRRGITVIAVGINTDSPAKFGIENVYYTGTQDMSKIIDLLATKLIRR